MREILTVIGVLFVFSLLALTADGGITGQVTKVDCSCPDQYLPVCGVDGQTYLNRCVADCLDVTVDRIGRCA